MPLHVVHKYMYSTVLLLLSIDVLFFDPIGIALGLAVFGLLVLSIAFGATVSTLKSSPTFGNVGGNNGGGDGGGSAAGHGSGSCYSSGDGDGGGNSNNSSCSCDECNNSCTTNVCLTQSCIEVAAFILGNLDRSVDPCEDFYNFTCGAWAQKTVIPTGNLYLSSVLSM